MLVAPPCCALPSEAHHLVAAQLGEIIAAWTQLNS
jgi:hypothetical protein